MKLAVLQLIDSFNQGGSERQALQLTRLLHESGRFKVYLASLTSEGSLRAGISDLEVGDVPSFPLTSFYDRNAVTQLRRFVKWLKTSRIDIVHTHDFYTNIFGMTGSRLAGTPVRIASMRETNEMRSSAQKQLQRAAYSFAHRIIANSNAVREKLFRDGVKENKVDVIYNGLQLERLSTLVTWDEALEKIVGLTPDDTPRRFVSIVANMSHEVKDYPMFLRAAKRVRQVVADAEFLLAGEGELTESLRALARELGIEDHVHFLGRCDNIAELLKISDICVLSSKAEGFSNSILEYMAASRPVVATDVGGAREAIKEGITGFLVQSGDDEAMANRLIWLLQDPAKAEEMGRAGRKVVEEKFSCDAQLQNTERLYSIVASEVGLVS
ncbi:MAG TPA: glycosyltransferase [Pyrinomonadaceae bacterium]|nr:glycosyltransferase [Pyrinomonadaceae bacterium]